MLHLQASSSGCKACPWHVRPMRMAAAAGSRRARCVCRDGPDDGGPRQQQLASTTEAVSTSASDGQLFAITNTNNSSLFNIAAISAVTVPVLGADAPAALVHDADTGPAAAAADLAGSVAALVHSADTGSPPAAAAAADLAGSVAVDAATLAGSAHGSFNSTGSSFSSMDDELTEADISAAKQAAAAAAAASPADTEPWWPPLEFSALVGLSFAAVLAGVTNMLLCKPAAIHCTPNNRITRQCTGCVASPAAQARHWQWQQRQPQLLLPALPLPLRQHVEQEQLPQPSYRVPGLVSLPASDDSWIAAALLAVQEWIYGRLAYHLQQLGTASLSTKVLALLTVALPFISVAGYAYHKAAGVTIREAMYKVYALLYRVPGVGIAKESNTASYLVANVVFLAGVFSFAAVIGIVSDEVKLGIKNSRTGNYSSAMLHSHILLVNWNSSSTALLRQIASAHAEGGMFQGGLFSQRPPVVVLADKPKAQMDEAVHEMLRDRGLSLEVHTRQGNPFKGSELRKVAAGKASTIIVLHPEGVSSQGSAEAIKTAVVMGLTALGPPAEQRIVVTGPLPAGSDHSMMQSLGVSARLAGHSAFQVLELPDSQLMHRLIAQTAAQPGVLTCWLDILALVNNSAQFYCAALPPALRGKTYMEIRRSFAHAVLTGYRSPDGKAVLNPPDSDVVPADSRLILLGRGGAAHLMASPSKFYESAASAAAERLKKERTYRSKPRSIIVVDWPIETTLELMEGFSLFTPASSCVTFIHSGEPLPSWPTRLGNCRFNFITAPQQHADAKVLLEAGIKAADAVVLGSGSSSSGAGELEADARFLSGMLQVQDAVLASKRREAPHLVAPIKRYATSKLASQYLDVLASEQANLQQQHQQPSSQEAPGGGGGGLPIIGPVLSALWGGGGGGGGSKGPETAPAASPAAAIASPAVICEPEFLVAQDVTSALITQVVSEPAYSDIMRALLFSDDGMELYLRNPASFNIPCGVPLSFAEVEEAVRLTNQTALGYIRGRSSRACSSGGSGSAAESKKQRSDWGRPVLGCGAAHTVTFGEHDRIVVLAQDFDVQH